MNTTLGVIVAVVLVLVVIGVLWYVSQQRQRQHRTEELKSNFGPEYDRAVDQYGESREAEKELLARKERVEQLHIKELSGEQSTRFAREWHEVQTRFVDNPEGAIADADRLVTEVMQVRGYPMGDFEQRAADVSVDHPNVVEHYRAAHDIAGKSARGDAETEDLRQAMVHYRSLFQDLIETREPVEARNDHAA
jgi:hypothetical protein